MRGEVVADQVEDDAGDAPLAQPARAVLDRGREPWRFELTSARGRPFRDPDADLVRRVLVHLSTGNYYAMLTRADDWYVQAGYGEQAGTRPGWYALERRDGAPDQHFRAELPDVEEVVRAFVGFLEDGPIVAVRFPWRPHAA